MTWTTDKPVIKEECILITGDKIKNSYDKGYHWIYQFYTVKRVSGFDEQEGAFSNIILYSSDGEIWGDAAYFKADMYCVVPVIKK